MYYIARRVRRSCLGRPVPRHDASRWQVSGTRYMTCCVTVGKSLNHVGDMLPLHYNMQYAVCCVRCAICYTLHDVCYARF